MLQIKIPAFSFEVLKKAPTPGSALSSAPNISLVNPELYDGKVCFPPNLHIGALSGDILCIHYQLSYWNSAISEILFMSTSGLAWILNFSIEVLMEIVFWGFLVHVWYLSARLASSCSGSLAARISEHLFWILFWRGIVLEQETETQSVFFLPVHD